MTLHKSLSKQGYIIKKDQIDEKILKEIKKDLTVKPIVLKAYQDFVKPTEFKIFLESPNYLFLPRHYGIEKLGPPIKDQMPDGAPIDIKITYDVLPHQKLAYEKSLKQLREKGGGVLSLPCGYGKTFLGIKLSSDLGKKTLIVVNKECLMDQWIESIEKFTNGKAKIGIIQQSTIDVENKDYVVAMLHSLSKKEYSRDIFADFGFCIIDECHHIGSEMFSQALPKVASKYMLGLSATPRRKDGLSKVFYNYIGELFHSEKRKGSNRVLVKRFKMTSSTSYYETLYMSNGIKNTGGMITNLSKYEARTELIIECIRSLMKQDRKILLLSGRREHLEQIYEFLEKSNIKNIHGKKITFGYYYGNQGMNKKEHKKMLAESAKCDVVLGTYAIASEGLDIPDLNTEILATSSTDVEQAVGRILRKFHDKINPLVVDLIDRCGNFPEHGRARSRFYTDEDYEIQDITIPLGHTSQELRPFISEIAEYLFDTDFKQLKFATKDDDDDDKEDQAVSIGQCLLNDGDQQQLPTKITLKKKITIKKQSTESQVQSIAPSSQQKLTSIEQIVQYQPSPANEKSSPILPSTNIKTPPKITLNIKKGSKVKVTGVTGGKNVRLNLGLCLLDDGENLQKKPQTINKITPQKKSPTKKPTQKIINMNKCVL